MKISFRTCIKLVITVLLAYIAIKYFNIVLGFVNMLIKAATPLLVGVALAYVLNILMSFYESHYFTKWEHKKIVVRSRRMVCMLSSIVSLLAIITAVIWLVLPSLIEALTFLLTESVPQTINKLMSNEFIEKHLPEKLYNELNNINWEGLVDKLGSVVMSGVGGVTNAAIGAVSSFVSSLVSAFISIVFAIYILIDRDRLLDQGKRIIHCAFSKIEDKIYYVGRVFNDSFRKFIVGQAIEALILGVLCTLGMLIFRFPYAGMVGALVGFTAIIPVAGAYIGGFVGAVMMLTESPLKALLFVVFLVVLQQVEGNLIYPKVVGKSVGLPAVWVLAAVIIGGALAGVVGMLLGVPLAAAIYRLIRHELRKKENEMAKNKVMTNEIIESE